MPNITLNGETVSYRVRRSTRARQISLRISPDTGLEIVIPQRAKVAQAEIETMLRSRTDWLLKHLARYQPAAEVVSARYADGSRMPYLGEDYPLRLLTGRGKSVRVGLEADYFRVHVPQSLAEDAAARQGALRDAFGRWYAQQARDYIPPRVADHAARMGLQVGRVSIKDQKTRWGSASSLNNLNFNRRLMMAPAAVIDYVIIHELCHFWEMNHSGRYWALVAQYCPDYKMLRGWLRTNGLLLQL